jgi:hypothetical protein
MNILIKFNNINNNNNNNNPLARWLIKGQDLQTKYWPHFQLSTDRGERSSSQFKGDLWSAYRVP